MKRLLIKNSFTGIAQTVINLVLAFFTIPLFIKMLGSESYGIFSLIMVIGSLNKFANLGLNNALVKFIAEQGHSKQSEIDILVALLMTLILLLPITTTALFFNKFILLVVLKVPVIQFPLAKGFFIWILLANFIMVIGNVFKSVLDGLQKIYITSVLQIVYNIFYWGLILCVLHLGYNLPAVGIAIFFATLVWLIITIISLVKIWGKFSFEGFHLNYKLSAKKQLNYGLKIYTGGLISFFFEPLSKVLISHFIGVSAVGYYDIALRLKGQVWGVFSKIFYPLFPFISQQKNINVVRKYVHDLEQKTFLLVVPIVSVVILLMQPFIKLWIGRDVEIISITAIFIISAYLIFSSTVIPIYQYLMAKNLAQKTIYIQLTNVVGNILFFLLTVKFIGYYSIIVGNVAAILGSFFLCLYYQKKYLNSLIFDNFSQLLRLTLVFIIITIIGYVIKSLLAGHDVLMIFIIPIVLTLITLLFYKILGLIKREDIYRYFGKTNRLSFMFVKFFNR